MENLGREGCPLFLSIRPNVANQPRGLLRWLNEPCQLELNGC